MILESAGRELGNLEGRAKRLGGRSHLLWALPENPDSHNCSKVQYWLLLKLLIKPVSSQTPLPTVLRCNSYPSPGFLIFPRSNSDIYLLFPCCNSAQTTCFNSSDIVCCKCWGCWILYVIHKYVCHITRSVWEEAFLPLCERRNASSKSIPVAWSFCKKIFVVLENLD